jgi:hypothetical protein
MRQALIAVGVFAALLVVVLATRDHGNVNVGVAKLELPTVDKAKVTSVEISGAMTATLKKEASGWTVADASKSFHPADDGQVNSLLEGLKDFKAEDFITDKAERLGELEVEGPKALTLKVFAEGTVPALEVVFGKQGKTGGTYLRTPSGKQVFITRSSLVWSARREANTWRKRGFFPSSLDQVSKVNVKLEDGTVLALESGTDGKWSPGATSPTPAGFRFDPNAAQRLVATLASISAMDFLDSAPGVPAQASVEAWLKDGKSVVLQLYPELAAVSDGGHPAQAGVPVRVEGDPQVYVIATSQAGELKKRLTDLRDTTLLAFDAAKAQKLVIAAGGKKTVVAKDGAGWKLVEPKAMPAGLEFEPSVVLGQLAALQHLRASAVAAGVTDAQAGFAKPTATVEVSVEGAPVQTVKFGGPAPSGQLYVKGSADALVYAIDAAARSRFETGVELFKKPPPPPANMGQMRGLESLPPDVRRQLEAQLRQQHP